MGKAYSMNLKKLYFVDIKLSTALLLFRLGYVLSEVLNTERIFLFEMQL